MGGSTKELPDFKLYKARLRTIKQSTFLEYLVQLLGRDSKVVFTLLNIRPKESQLSFETVEHLGLMKIKR